MKAKMNKNTLAIIKPDAFDKRYPILDMIKEFFYVDYAMVFEYTEESAAEFYKELSDKSFFTGLVEHACSGKSLGLILRSREDFDAVLKFRELIGNTDPQKADEGTIRKCFGQELPKNAIHGSDSKESFEKEKELIFAKRIKNDYNIL
jgi:nucleoside diphosphate kinase